MSTILDPAEFPLTHAYIARLPEGLASHRGCEVKGSVLREMVDNVDRTLVPKLPEPVRALVQAPPPVSAWVPEVLLNVLLHSSAEQLARDARNPDAMVDRAFDATRRLLSTPLYKVLFLLVSPDRLISGVDKRWSALRRGTTLEVLEQRPRHVRLRVSSPPHLYDPPILRVRAASVRAAIYCAGAVDPRVDLAESSATAADFIATWR